MSVTTIDATLQGFSYKIYQAIAIDWNFEVRDASVGTVATTVTTNVLDMDSIRVQLYLFRGSTAGACGRTFLFFDLSSIVGTITSATLKVLGYYNGTCGVIPVKSTAWGGNGTTTTLSTSNYSALDYSNVYSSAITSWNTSTYNDFTLNSTAISDMNSSGYLNICLIDNTYDYLDTSPPLGTNIQSGIEYLDGVNNIKLEITYGTSYGNNVIGVNSVDISSVIGVDASDISTVIGV